MNMKNYRKRNFRRNSAGMNHTFAVLAVIFLSVFIVCGSVYLIFDFYSYYIAPALSGREVLTSADGSGGNGLRDSHRGGRSDLGGGPSGHGL